MNWFYIGIIILAAIFVGLYLLVQFIDHSKSKPTDPPTGDYQEKQ